jgi:hypothetical protein
MDVAERLLTSGLALWFLSLRERRPILADICLGALTIKPQLGFLFPILLVIERRWTVMLVAGLTTVVMVLALIAAFGYAVWPSYALEVLPFQREVMMKLGGTFLTMMPSAFGMARLSEYESDTALAIHMAVAIPVFAITFYVVSRTRQSRAADYLLPVAIFLITPYALNYDMGLVGVAMALFIRQEEQAGRPFSTVQNVIFALAMTTPATMMIAGRFWIGTAPVVLGCLFFIMVSRTTFGPSYDTRFSFRSFRKRQTAS